MPETEPHERLVYARAMDRLDNFATMNGSLRLMLANANGMLFGEAWEFGAVRDVRVVCDETGAARVDNVVLNVLSPLVDFGAIATELHRQGFTSDLEKYWVWYDKSGLERGLPGGQGEIRFDDRLVEANANNEGGQIAVTYGYTGESGAFIMLHEGGHTLGAVQLSSPHTSGGWHCNDGLDVMCYADGGTQSAYDPTVCALQHFDCNHDDYFHPNPPGDSYLATHWNVGSTLVRFLDHSGSAPPPPPPPPPPPVGPCTWVHHGGQAQWASVFIGAAPFPNWAEDVGVPANCPGTGFNLTSTSPTADFDVCWLGHATTLACEKNVGPESGVIPQNATTMRVVLRQGALGEYDLRAP